MSAGDPQQIVDHLLDLSSNLSSQLARYGNDLADYIDQHVDRCAGLVRDSLASAPWLPAPLRPSPPPPPPVAVVAVSRIQNVQHLLSRHKILTGLFVFVCSAALWRGVQHRRQTRRPRKARRAKNGGRCEVVVLVGPPATALTKSLALDLERRGFIVHVACDAVEEEALVQAYARPDIRPLLLDTANPSLSLAAVERFATYLQSPHAPTPNVRPNHLTLRSIIFVPNLSFQIAPIATISPSSFAELFNTHLLQPMLSVQAFLPLLTSRLGPAHDSTDPPKLLLTPAIISSISPPFHAPEATITAALTSFTEVLSAELRPIGIPVTHLQLGTFDFSGFSSARGSMGTSAHPKDTLAWPSSARHVYGRNFVSQASSAISGGRITGLRGSSLWRLHNTVFDVIDGTITSNVLRVGLGASFYGALGRWAPRSLVSWIMGVRPVNELPVWKSSLGEVSSRGESDGSEMDTPASHELISIPSEQNVWSFDMLESHLWVPSGDESAPSYHGGRVLGEV